MKDLSEKEKYIRKPSWLKAQVPSTNEFFALNKELNEKGLFTVCQEAKCPNIGECWSKKTATIMILGDTCTRACKFCHVKTGNPKGFVNQDEVANAVKMVDVMGLRYLVITSVDRDDLEDYGSGHFANVVSGILKEHPDVKVEVLIPDFNEDESCMHTLAQSHPFVIAQNLETVKRLTYPVRDRRAGYEKTLNVLDFYKKNYPHIKTKSSLMVGLGETRQELTEAMKDLRQKNVDIITFGQYLRPNRRLLPVDRYYHPDEFLELKEEAYALGFDFVASGPMVRSSYKASEYLDYLEAQSQAVFEK